MTQPIQHESYPDTHHDIYSKTVFGFWIYLMTDFILFATLFATYIVLQSKTFGGPTAAQIFNLSFNLVQALILLTCSFTSGIGGAFAHRRKKIWTIVFFAITAILGFIFFEMQLSEFLRLIRAGHSWKESAFLSAYFTLIGTHGVHMIFAILWVILLLIPVFRQGVTPISIRRLTCLRSFWQFLNVIWVFIFTIVYLMGRA